MQTRFEKTEMEEIEEKATNEKTLLFLFDSENNIELKKLRIRRNYTGKFTFVFQKQIKTFLSHVPMRIDFDARN